MAILDFIRRASRQDLQRMLLLTVVAGLANALLVVMVNNVAGYVARGQRPRLLEWLVFGGAFVIYYQCNQFALLRANRVIEDLLKRLRVEVADKLRRSELAVVDSLGRGNLYTLVSQETNHLSVAFPLLVDTFQQTVLLTISLLYLLYLSPAAFLVFVLSVFVGVFGYHRINTRFSELLHKLAQCQARMLDTIGDIIHGSKELRLNARRSEAVDQTYRKLSRAAEALLIAAGDHWSAMILLSGVVIYFILGVVAFIFPQLAGGHNLIVFKLTPILLFCFGPMAKIIAQSPMFTRAEVGLRAVLGIERQLDAAGGISPSEARYAAAAFRDFRRIHYAGLTFSYRDKKGDASFTLGPLDLALTRGETMFIVGGNGSGKSTTLRLMTGLHAADAGEIRVDDAVVSGPAIAGFRELFSAIFVDFHLFDRLYGLEQVDPRRVNDLIAEMGLAGKVRYQDGRFSQLHLSTGQRKRLALVAALLEDRPIYVFDEWSADQDAHFREYFYNTVLARLRAAGKTVVVVTHDERFWHLADRVIKLDLGAVEWERTGAGWQAP
jgi:putative ATP-binding cassette transporter